MKAEYLNWGPPALREWADAITDKVNADEPIAGENIFLVPSENGTAINLGEQPDEGD